MATRDERQAGAAPDTPLRERWRMLALGFVGLNLSVALVLGTYGTLLSTVEQRFDVSRGTATLPPSVAFLLMALLSPVVGTLLQRYPIRPLMMLGAAVNAAAAAGLVVTDNITLFTLLYGVLGAGMAFLGLIGPFALVTRWFAEGRGKALALLNMPLGFLIAPLLGAYMVQHHDLSRIYVLMAGLYVLAVPLMLLVKDPPGYRSAPADAGPGQAPRLFLRDRRFWVLALGIGMITGLAQAFSVHIIPYMTGMGIPLERAAAVMSLYGLCNIAGVYLFGMLIDKVTARNTLIILSGMMTVMWLGVVAAMGLYSVVPPLLLLGCCIVAISVVQGAAAAELFDAAEVNRVLGACYLMKIPFTFTAAPVVGYLFVWSGGYGFPLGLATLLGVAATALFVLLRHLETARLRPAPA